MLPVEYSDNRLGSADAPVVVEGFLDFLCPFCKKYFINMTETIFPAIEKEWPGMVQHIYMHHPQPWHILSALCSEAAIAASKLAPGKFYQIARVLYDNQENFKEKVAYNKGRLQATEEIADLLAPLGVDKAKFMDAMEVKTNGVSSVVNDFKWFVKYSRHHHVHVSPTALINGLPNPNVSSGWTTNQWLEALRPSIPK
eukprot:comp17231_c1_seq1/m.16254 comp17231_c1_seq1/g.16254  ORF comp17231_c1_seq1/g.16254 comp17231_c1_seq1/m.16254 type:complete len:198 (-) comp17231_c1_seq1:166-759(-)